MKYTKMFNAIINEGFSTELALLSTALYLMNVDKPVSLGHLNGKGTFTEELLRSFRKRMWDEDEALVNEAIKIWEVIYDYDLSQSFHGLGGCERKPIRECLALKVDRDSQ